MRLSNQRLLSRKRWATRKPTDSAIIPTLFRLHALHNHPSCISRWRFQPIWNVCLRSGQSSGQRSPTRDAIYANSLAWIWRWPFIFFFVLFVRRENERVKKNERGVLLLPFEKKKLQRTRSFENSLQKKKKRNFLLLLLFFFIVKKSSFDV